MKPAVVRAVFAWVAAALMLGMWQFSRHPWSERQDITSSRNWRGTRDFTATYSPDALGADFYFGGNSVLLLAAAGIVAMTCAGGTTDRLPGVIAFGAALLGGVALVRFTLYFNNFGSSTLLQYGGSGHYPTEEARLSLYATVALAAVGLILLFLGPVTKEAPTGSTQVPPNSAGA